MCNLTHDHNGQFGFIVDVPEIRALIDEARRVAETVANNAVRVDALRPAFARLLAADGWLPEAFAQPDVSSGMGGGIGQYSTPVHDHLAWGLVGVYRGAQLDTTYERLDDGAEPERATLRVAIQQTVTPGEFYTLLPPDGDIHYVKTVSPEASVSIHLLANDTACVWRHKFDPEAGTVTAFRSGYSNVKCKQQ